MKAIFIVFFGAVLLIGASFIHFDLTITSLIVIGLATIRLARTISYNGVGEPLRKYFTRVAPDSCGAGMNVEPVGTGIRYTIGELIACPICSGTWSAFVMVVCWQYIPAVVYVFAVAGASEFLHWLMEKYEWEGRQARVTSGQISPDPINAEETLFGAAIKEEARGN